MMRIQPDMRPAREYLNRLEKRDIPKVVGRSLDRTGKSVMALFSRRIRQRINLKKSVVDKSLKTRRSSEIQNLVALALGRAYVELIVSGRPIPLRDFAARQVKRGVTYSIRRGGGRKQYTALGQQAFIVRSLGGHVFVRRGPEPPGPATIGIRKVYGPALPHFLLSKKEQRELLAHAAKVWPEEITRNARYALMRRGAL